MYPWRAHASVTTRDSLARRFFERRLDEMPFVNKVEVQLLVENGETKDDLVADVCPDR